jgi:hypothetical protein
VPAVDGVNVLVQVAVPAVAAARVHIEKVPVTPVEARDNAPVGVEGVAEVSVTVAVHVLVDSPGNPTVIVVGVHDIVVVVVCAVGCETLTVVLPVLAACAVSPA